MQRCIAVKLKGELLHAAEVQATCMNLCIEQFVEEALKHMVSHVEQGTMHHSPEPAVVTFAGRNTRPTLATVLLHD